MWVPPLRPSNNEPAALEGGLQSAADVTTFYRTPPPGGSPPPKAPGGSVRSPQTL